MNNPLTTLENLDWSDSRVKIGAAGVGAVAVYLFWQGHKEAKTGSTQDSSDIPETFGTTRQPGTDVPGVIGNVGSYPVAGPAGPAGAIGKTGAQGKPGKDATTPKPNPAPKPKGCGVGQIGVLRSGKIVCAGAPSKATITCPPGYVVVQSAGKPQRCSAKDDTKLGKGLKATFYPKKGKGGEAVSAMDAYAGKVGGSFPAPMPLTARYSYTVQEGDTAESISRKVYGAPHWFGKLINYNGPLHDMTVGDVLDVGS